MLAKNSLKIKLIISFSLMVFVAVAIEAFDLIYIQRPLNYAIELKADQKDILRIKSAFTSKANELNVLTYDNAVWDETYKFIDKENPLFPERIFDKDAFTSLNIHGIHLYSNNFPHVWGKSYNQDFSKLLPFPAFDQPGTFIKNNLLITPKMVSDNNGKPFSHSGYINIENQLIIFSATSIFHSNAQGNSNGTMVYWRYLDDNGIVDLQKRAGIKFTLSTKSKSFPQNSLNTTSLRTVKNDINTAIPLFGNSGSIGISYQAPTRLFDVNWLNRSTVMTLSSFFLILLTLTLLTHVIVIRPILYAGEKIKKIVQSNNRISRFNTKRTDELGSLFSLIDLLLASIASQEQELISHNVKLQQISETDDLTKIANRRAFDLYMTKLFTIEEKGLPVSILVCDIDYFKNYNDCYGHSNGDNALRLVAMSLQRNLHQETDFLARYGGEEFVIILKNTALDEAYSVANNLLKNVRNLKINHEKSAISSVITVSIGIHSFKIPDNKNQQRAMFYFEKADKALYVAKKEGRNRAVHYIENEG